MKTPQDMSAIQAAIRDIRKGMGVRTAATKRGLSRDRLRYWVQKKDAEHARFTRAIAEEKHGKTQG